jgi:glycosyltransferase involved in cell wall biosynthesis
MLGRLAAIATGRPAIVHLHDARPMASWVRMVQHRLAPRTHSAIVVSEALRPVAVEDYGMPQDRVQVIYNGVDRDTFACVPADARQRVRREMRIADAAKVIGMVGRIEPDKGMMPLLEAMPQVHASCPDAVLLVVGDGTIRADCERYAGQLGIAKLVRFTGFRNDVPELLAAMDIVAAPSIVEEGLGYAALEAMCAGLPVVASRSGGLAESVLHGETGLLVARGSVRELAGALVTLLNDDRLRERFAAAARQRIAAFSVTGHVERLQALYREVVDAKTHPVITVAPPHDGPRGVPRASGRGAQI